MKVETCVDNHFTFFKNSERREKTFAALGPARHARTPAPLSQKAVTNCLGHGALRLMKRPCADANGDGSAKPEKGGKSKREMRQNNYPNQLLWKWSLPNIRNIYPVWVVSPRSSGAVQSQGSETTAPEQTRDIAVTRPGAYRHHLP